MCKIICASGNPDVLTGEKLIAFEQFMRTALTKCNLNMEDNDATGMFTTKNNAFVFIKNPGDAQHFIDNTPEWKHIFEVPQQTYMMHCRGAMSDVLKNENNHPFFGRRIALVHEGWLDNHKAVAQKLGIALTTETDSEVFMRFLDDRARKTGTEFKTFDPVDACYDVIKLANAPTSIAFTDVINNKTYFVRNLQATHEYIIWTSDYFGGYRFLLPSEYILAAGCHDAFGTDSKKRYGSLAKTRPFVAYEL